MAQREWVEKDFYSELGVSSDANADEIKKAYRRLARENHPDSHPGDAAAEDRFKAVAEAYDVVGDATKRREYDQTRAMFSGAGAGFGGGGFGGAGGAGAGAGVPFDINDLFGAGGAGGGGPHGACPAWATLRTTADHGRGSRRCDGRGGPAAPADDGRNPGMVWTWRYEKADGSVVVLPGEQEGFQTQGDAESWIGEEWKQLLEDGVDRAALLEDGTALYTMSLHEG